MQILDLDILRDGGTITIKTDEGDYHIDGRINSTTKGKIFLGYPMSDCSNMISNDSAIVLKLRNSLINYSPKKFKDLVWRVINQLDLYV